MAGGGGGFSGNHLTNGGAGGVTAGQNGGAGNPGGESGGGGGGAFGLDAGTPGGGGGSTFGGIGGAGGATPGAAGANGTNTGVGGGGGGGGGVHGLSSALLANTITASQSGGAGGNGANAAAGGGGGGGGAGGYGVFISVAGSNTGVGAAAILSGGAGGAGGTGGNAAGFGGGGGGGGDGGVGLFITGAGSTLLNQGQIRGAAGGAGAAGGTGGVPGPAGASGAGGVGVDFGGGTLTNGGTIQGGGTADAIVFRSASTLQLADGLGNVGTLTGGLGLTGTLTLDTNGVGAATIGGVIRNADGVGRLSTMGAGTITLGGVNTFTGGVTLGGTATVVLTNNNLGQSGLGTGTLTFAAGAQRLTLNGAASFSLPNEIVGIGTGDTILISGFAFNAAANTFAAGNKLNLATAGGVKTAVIDFGDAEALALNSFTIASANGGADTLISFVANVGGAAPAPPAPVVPAPPPTVAPALGAGFSSLLRYQAVQNPPLPTTVTTPTGQILPNPLLEQQKAIQALIARVDAGQLTLRQAQDIIVDMADATTSVASMSYQFFTGKLPTKEGLDYLVSSPQNPNDLNDGYYAGMSLENRYINFAVNLGKTGEGRATFNANYGSLSLADAAAKAYAEIFGPVPAGKVAAILTPERSAYFLSLGGDALGQKAAMVGWLLGEAAKTDTGPYAARNENFLYDLLDGTAAFGADAGIYAGAGPTTIALVGVAEAAG